MLEVIAGVGPRAQQQLIQVFRERADSSGVYEMDFPGAIDALVEADGNRSRAARLLGVSRATLYRFLSAHPDEF